MRYLVLLLASCAAPRLTWYHPAGSATFKADSYECHRDARVVQWSHLLGAEAGVDEDFYDECMASKGWLQRPEAEQAAAPAQPIAAPELGKVK